jgi:glutamate 5-kinase
VRVVVKIGTSSLTDEKGVIDDAMIQSACAQIAAARVDGHEVLLVTSAAVSAGVAALGFDRRPGDLGTLQALAALGQPRLMERYNRCLAGFGLVAGQVLLVPHDFIDRSQYLHARRTLSRLLDLGCVPIINENDAVASHELRFGDNDRIAALVSHLMTADLLVLLTDTPGLYTADPRHDASAALIADVAADDPLLAVSAGATGTTRGSGGMASKLTAARIASWSGVRAVIAQAQRPDVLAEAIAGVTDVGTTFHANDRRLPARKLWIAFASQVEGSVVVDDGARRALLERGTSLLPAGVVKVLGEFDDGATVEVVGADGAVFARGMTLVDAADIRRGAGRRTSELSPDMAHEVIHRDDLVLLPG